MALVLDTSRDRVHQLSRRLELIEEHSKLVGRNLKGGTRALAEIQLEADGGRLEILDGAGAHEKNDSPLGRGEARQLKADLGIVGP